MIKVATVEPKHTSRVCVEGNLDGITVIGQNLILTVRGKPAINITITGQALSDLRAKLRS